MNRMLRAGRRFLTGGLLLVYWGTSLALIGCAQPIQTPPGEEANMLEIMKAPGKRLAEGKNKTPTGPLRVKTYYVDEIRLAKPITISQNGSTRSVDKVYRLTITGEQFPVRALLPVIWIDGKAYTNVQQSEDLRSLSVLLYDRAALKEGATLAVGYSEDIKDLYTTLPEKLHFKEKR